MSHWRDGRTEREVWVLEAESARDWPAHPPWSSAGFCLLFAAEHVVDVTRLAQAALDQGLAFACSWGPGCEMIEETFDEVIVSRGGDETEDDVVLTTSHAGETLEEAIEFFLDVATPASAREPSCGAWTIFPLGAACRARVERALRRRGAEIVVAR